MSLKGIDISSWQAGLNIGAIDADFVICKATEGVGYVDAQCDVFYQQAKSLGKLLGVYHFARPDLNDPISEADFFVNNIQGYIGEAILVLDWEVNPKNNINWAKQWLDRVQNLTGVKPLIYMSTSVVNSYDWSSVVAGDYGLWVAQYRDYNPDYNYDYTNRGPYPDVKWWNGYAMWQWTSSGRLNGYGGNLDCNEWYGDANAWRAYAKKPTPPAPEPTPEPIPPTPEPIPEPTPEPTPPTPPEPPVPPVPPTPEYPSWFIQFWIKVWEAIKNILGIK